MFSGTVRENLDPRGLHEDLALWQAVEQCHLSEVITSMGEYQALPCRVEEEEAGRGQGEAWDPEVKCCALQAVWMVSWARGAGAYRWGRGSCCV